MHNEKTPPEVSGTTRVAALVGKPARHSLSPAIHNAAFRSLQLDWIYTVFEVGAKGGQQAVAAMRSLELGGLSVTMPLKHEVARAVDELTDVALKLESCNCVYWDGDRLVGDSTDGKGFVRAFEKETESTFTGKRLMVLGAGGAARSVIAALAEEDTADIVIVNRSAPAAISASKLATNGRTGSFEDSQDVDIIINATAVGMKGGSDPSGMPIPAKYITSEHTIVDIVYSPLKTELLLESERRGAKMVGGLPMLVCQAAYAFEHWTEKSAPLDVMYGSVATMIN